MLIIYEVIVAKGQDPDSLLPEDVLREAQIQIMSVEEAQALGFKRAQPDPEGREIRLVAVMPGDARYIQQRLEGSAAVQSFRAHQVEV